MRIKVLHHLVGEHYLVLAQGGVLEPGETLAATREPKPSPEPVQTPPPMPIAGASDFSFTQAAIVWAQGDMAKIIETYAKLDPELIGVYFIRTPPTFEVKNSNGGVNTYLGPPPMIGPVNEIVASFSNNVSACLVKSGAGPVPYALVALTAGGVWYSGLNQTPGSPKDLFDEIGVTPSSTAGPYTWPGINPWTEQADDSIPPVRLPSITWPAAQSG